MWETLRKEEVLRNLKTNRKEGLESEEVKIRQEKFGKNILQEKNKETIFKKFIKQFQDFMIIILIIASLVSAGISYFQGENDYIDSVIILSIVILNSIMGVIQEIKAEKAIEALKQMTPQKAKVIREGKKEEIDAKNLVPGDIVFLEAGNIVPADCRLIECFNFKVEESSLTGETESVTKNADIICKKDVALGDKINMIYMSSTVVNGHAKAVVTDIGMNTKVGQIASMINKNEAPKTPLQKRLAKVGKTLGIVCLAICIIIFVIGLIRKIDIVEMFMTSVGLAVAAIPEGLPAIVTIVLSIGVTKMAKKNSIIRKLPAVETLGSTRVICSDKTGTLTKNKMKVVEIKSKNPVFTLELANMCTDCEIKYEDNKEKVSGDPTEVAIVEEALQKGINKIESYHKMPRINEISFDSNRKMMTTIHKLDKGYRIITKGALEEISKRCIKQIGENTFNKINVQNENLNMANKALRVLAIAYKDVDVLPSTINSQNVENNLTFVGLIGMIDPPREGVKEAIKSCKNAGIKTVMITGDHIATATAIAKELKILMPEDKVLTGKELDQMTEKELEKNIKSYSVFARVTPEHKVRIVKAWQRKGAVVAMTGDGVNDSPALKKADIGIAMGKNGTDVAKNASDMILTDDNFVTIVEAVKQGRNIYDNITKAIHFLIATNIGEIVTIFLGLILGFESPLLAIQLLWINLITDSFPAIALGLEPAEKDIMKRKPVDKKQGIFANGLWNKIIVEGIMIGALTLLSFTIGNIYYNLEVARTMAFLTIGISELIHSFNVKSEKSIFKTGILENKFLIGSFVLGVLVQLVVILIPTLAEIFDLVNLNTSQLLITILISIMPIPIMELQKMINNRYKGRIIFMEKQEV